MFIALLLLDFALSKLYKIVSSSLQMTFMDFLGLLHVFGILDFFGLLAFLERHFEM
jgi:hypothetical protein